MTTTTLTTADRIRRQWLNGILTAAECRDRLEALGVAVTAEEYADMLADEVE